MAGGFTIQKDKISKFRDFLIRKYEKSSISASELSNLYLDTIIAPSALNIQFYEEINILGPFGSGNSEPRFVIENLQVIKSNIVGENHIKSLLLGKDGTVFKSFTRNAKNNQLGQILINNNKKIFNAAGKMRLNEWQGKKDVEFIIEDISIN